MRGWNWKAVIALLVFLGGCIALVELNGDEGPNEDTKRACADFRDMQADPPSDADAVAILQRILNSDASVSVMNGARDLAVALESNATSTEVQDAIRRLDAGCDVNDL